MTIAPRAPSNTLIVTNVADGILNEPQEFMKFLAKDHKYCIQLISLIKFGRIILVCETKDIAIEVRESIAQSLEWCKFKISYSIRDNDFIGANPNLSVNNNHDGIEDILGSLNTQIDNQVIDYLELPSDLGSKRFLISPPRSPPPDWDLWDKVEEGPNDKAIHSPEDISHLLWQKLGGNDSSIVRKYQDEDEESNTYIDEKEVDIKVEPEVLFEGLDEGVPAIIIDPAKMLPRKSKSPSVAIPKTAIPPLGFD